MAFSRTLMPGARPDPAALTADMSGIGLNFAAAPNPTANAEDTLVFASELGMDDGDLRVLAMLTTWFGQHHALVNADRLVRVVAAHPSARLRAFWAALAAWQSGDRRFRRLATDHEGERHDLLPVGTEFQLRRRGPDERFEGSPLRVPKGILRDRAADVLSKEALVRLHPGIRNRVRFGPNWRADVWTALEADPQASTAEIARRSYSSFATAWQVAQDFRLLREAMGNRGSRTKSPKRSRTA